MTMAVESFAAYDAIANEYTKSKELPFRHLVEKATLLKLIGNSMTNGWVLDLACGDGYYSRVFRDEMKASFVYGVDISKSMLDMAKSKEAQDSLRKGRIQYKISDVANMSTTEPVDQLPKFDIVAATYLLCYAHTKEELLKFCQVIAANLKEGGKLVALNDNPGDDPNKYTTDMEKKVKKYSLLKTMVNDNSPRKEQDLLRYELFNSDETVVTFDIFWWSFETYDWALRTAGFTSWRWVNMELDEHSGEDPAYWQDFLINCPIIALEAIK